MRRPLWLRTVIAVWAVWLGVTLVGPAGLIPCPVHGNHASHGMSAMDDMSAMPGMAGMDRTAQHGSSGHTSNSHCTCVGACCCAATVSPPAAQLAEIAIDEPALTVRPVVPSADERTPAADPPHTLPFANAPPVGA